MDTIPQDNKQGKIILLPLSQNKFAQIDPVDADLLQYAWQYTSKGYARRHLPWSNGRPGKQQQLHRVILARHLQRELLPQEQVDHIDRDKLNNCRYNLRLASNSQNTMNREKYTSLRPYKGVQRYRDRWSASIRVNKKLLHLGYYDTPEQAANIYNQAALLYHKDFACLNDVPSMHVESNVGKLFKSNTSGYRGVTWKKGRNCWCAQLQYQHKNRHIGYFNTPEDAARAYNEAALHYFGQKARLNVIE